MKSITITIDLKSLCLGAVGVLCIVSLSNFNKSGDRQPDPVNDLRRYQAVVGDRETIILDTQTGKFLTNPAYGGHPRWQKGEFNAMHNSTAPKTD